MNCFILIPLFTESLDENKEDRLPEARTRYAA